MIGEGRSFYGGHAQVALHGLPWHKAANIHRYSGALADVPNIWKSRVLSPALRTSKLANRASGQPEKIYFLSGNG